MPRGVIVVRVKEAHGRNKKDDIVWEQNFIEGFVRAELRGADKSKLTVGLDSSFPLIAPYWPWRGLHIMHGSTAASLNIVFTRECLRAKFLLTKG